MDTRTVGRGWLKFAAFIHERRVALGTRYSNVGRAAWGDALDEVREVVLEDRWLHRVGPRAAHGPAPAGLHDDAAVAALRDRWTRRVAAEVGARRFEVEVEGVIVVWVRRG